MQTRPQRLCARPAPGPAPALTRVHQVCRRTERRHWLVWQRQRAAHRNVAPLLLMHLADLQPGE